MGGGEGMVWREGSSVEGRGWCGGKEVGGGEGMVWREGSSVEGRGWKKGMGEDR